jgi:hypothetical protein
MTNEELKEAIAALRERRAVTRVTAINRSATQKSVDGGAVTVKKPRKARGVEEADASLEDLL